MTYIMSVLSIAMIYLMGNRWKYAPIVGLINQTLWIYYTISKQEWGLAPMVIAYTVIHARNSFKWLNE